MIDTQTACDRAAQLVEYAKRAGGDAGDAMATASMSQTISVRLGALEDADRSEDDGISLRVFVGKRSASVSGSDVSADAMADMAERAVAMARHAPEDPYARIATPDELAQGPFADLDLTDDAAPRPPPKHCEAAPRRWRMRRARFLASPIATAAARARAAPSRRWRPARVLSQAMPPPAIT